MKRLSKFSSKLAFGSLSLATTALVAAPATSFALSSRALAATTTPRTSAFCTNLSAKATSITTTLANRADKANDIWGARDAKLTANFARVDEAVAVAREKADAERTTDFTDLEAKATTSAQKQAVQTYEAAVRKAIATRRTAYDAARNAFRTGVQTAIINHNSSVSSQLSTFETAANAAFTTAETACASNTGDAATIRTTLQASLKATRDDFQTDRKADAGVGSKVKALVTVRQAAFKTADTAFHASMTAARQALQQALGNTSA